MCYFNAHLLLDFLWKEGNGAVLCLPVVQLIFDILRHLKWQNASTHYNRYTTMFRLRQGVILCCEMTYLSMQPSGAPDILNITFFCKTLLFHILVCMLNYLVCYGGRALSGIRDPDCTNLLNSSPNVPINASRLLLWLSSWSDRYILQ